MLINNVNKFSLQCCTNSYTKESADLPYSLLGLVLPLIRYGEAYAL